MSTAKKNYIQYFHIAVVFILAFGIPRLEPFGQITEYGMDILGIFIGLLYGWIFCGLFLLWSSIFVTLMAKK